MDVTIAQPDALEQLIQIVPGRAAGHLHEIGLVRALGRGNRESPAQAFATLLGVTLRQLQRGATLSLADCFRMELGMAAHAFEQGDFLEGVRAVLIDKDNHPRWQPRRIEDVTDAMIDAFFTERWRGAHHPLAALESLATGLPSMAHRRPAS